MASHAAPRGAGRSRRPTQRGRVARGPGRGTSARGERPPVGVAATDRQTLDTRTRRTRLGKKEPSAPRALWLASGPAALCHSVRPSRGRRRAHPAPPRPGRRGEHPARPEPGPGQDEVAGWQRQVVTHRQVAPPRPTATRGAPPFDGKGRGRAEAKKATRHTPAEQAFGEQD